MFKHRGHNVREKLRNYESLKTLDLDEFFKNLKLSDLNAQNAQKETALHCVVKAYFEDYYSSVADNIKIKNKFAEVIVRLINTPGIDLTIKDSDGVTALEHIHELYYHQSLKYNSHYDRKNPIHYCNLPLVKKIRQECGLTMFPEKPDTFQIRNEIRKKLFKEDFDYDVVISGKGPAGLAAAFNLLKKGKKVLLISNRSDDYVRVQKIRIDFDTAKNILNIFKLPSDSFDGFDEKAKRTYQILKKAADGPYNVDDNYCYIAVKDVERFFTKCINTFMESLEEEKNEENCRLAVLHKITITSVDLESGSLQLSDTREISFRDLICADGAGHSTADLLKKVDGSPMFNYAPVVLPHELPNYHVSGYIEINKIAGVELEFEKKNLFIRTITTEDNSLTAYCMPDFVSWEKSNHESIKCYVIAELSQEQYDFFKLAENQESLREKVMPHFYDLLSQLLIIDQEKFDINFVKKSSKHGLAKDYMKCVLFKTNNKIADRPYVVSDSGHGAFLMGDAYGANDYRLGNGVKNFVSVLPSVIQFVSEEVANETLDNSYNNIFKSHVSRLSDKSNVKFNAKSNAKSKDKPVELVEPLSNAKSKDKPVELGESLFNAKSKDKPVESGKPLLTRRPPGARG